MSLRDKELEEQPVARQESPSGGTSARPAQPAGNAQPGKGTSAVHEKEATRRTCVRVKIECTLVGHAVTGWKRLWELATDKWTWARSHVKVRRIKKRLRVCESVSLGEKRFVAVIQVDGDEFLVGGAANSVCTLARLQGPQEFPDLLKQGWVEETTQA